MHNHISNKLNTPYKRRGAVWLVYQVYSTIGIKRYTVKKSNLRLFVVVPLQYYTIIVLKKTYLLSKNK